MSYHTYITPTHEQRTNLLSLTVEARTLNPNRPQKRKSKGGKVERSIYAAARTNFN